MPDYPVVAVVVPFYQKSEGLLLKAVNSAFNQTYKGKITVVIVDDESPCPAKEDLKLIQDKENREYILFEKENGGAGSARNVALENIPAGTEYVAFLDSDDSWRPEHLENALSALGENYDAYFSDWWSYNFPEQTNFERIQALDPSRHKLLDYSNAYELGVSPIRHILSDGGGVIQTSTVVYRYSKYSKLRFREEFYNGQDFFFWMDLGELGAKFVFSMEVDCENGEGINIYQGAGWGTERSLQRLRNELFVWTSAERFYSLPNELYKANKRTIRHLQNSIIRDLMHRITNRKPISFSLIKDIIKMAPSTVMFFFVVPIKIILEKIR